MKLDHSFYLRNNVVEIARDLIGKILFTHFEDITCAGIITETEAYAGIRDKASHAYGGRRTARTSIMYHQGGVAYVYQCYGMHALFNIVTGPGEVPDAILIRAIKPLFGQDKIIERLEKSQVKYGIIQGPGRVSKALGIKVIHTGADLTGNMIWLGNTGIIIDPLDIICSPRIGIAYAEEDAQLHYRFNLSKRLAEVLKEN